MGRADLRRGDLCPWAVGALNGCLARARYGGNAINVRDDLASPMASLRVVTVVYGVNKRFDADSDEFKNDGVKQRREQGE